MKIATWNVNSVRARLERLVDWLGRYQVDALCLQELKVTDEVFPFGPIEEAGYHAVVTGQKTYNGVAILSRSEPKDVRRGIQDDVDDPQARLISAEIDGIRVMSAYVPNGRAVGSDAYQYKLDWFARLRAYMDKTFQSGDDLILTGDLNVATDDCDVAEPEAWADSVLCEPQVRRALSDVCDWGLVDVFRAHNAAGGVYSWWDYRAGAFPKNNGLRIDHILASVSLAGRCTKAEVDRDERKVKGELKPSDHAPVIAVFD